MKESNLLRDKNLLFQDPGKKITVVCNSRPNSRCRNMCQDSDGDKDRNKDYSGCTKIYIQRCLNMFTYSNPNFLGCCQR
jgi:hypothetical protein